MLLQFWEDKEALRFYGQRESKVLNNRRPQGGPPSERGGDACWKFRIKRSIRPTGVPAKAFVCTCNCTKPILGDPGADSGDEGKSKQAGKYGTKEK